MSKLNDSESELAQPKPIRDRFLIAGKLILGYTLVTFFWLIILPAFVGLVLATIFEPTVLLIAVDMAVAIFLYKFVPWKKIGPGFKELKDQIKRNL